MALVLSSSSPHVVQARGVLKPISGKELIPYLRGLAPSIYSIVISFHDLDSALINANRGNSALLRNQLARTRGTLKSEWETLNAFVQECYNVVDRVISLLNFIGEESDDDCLELLQELAQRVEQLNRTCQSVIDCQARTIHRFQLSSPSVMQQLDSSVDLSSSGRTNMKSSVTAIPESMAPPGQGISPDLKAFLQNSFVAAHPEGHAALSATINSMAQTHNSLSMMLQFWQSLHASCLAFLAANSLRNAFPGIGLKDKILSEWDSIRRELISAKSSIARSMDAVLIEAEGVPRRKGSFPKRSSTSDSRRAGSRQNSVYSEPLRRSGRTASRQNSASMTEKALPAVPTPRRKRTATFDDGVPSSCWGIGLFTSAPERKRR